METSRFNSGFIGASGEKVILDVAGMVLAAIQTTGTWVGTLQFEATINEDDWFSIEATPIPTGTNISSVTANDKWTVNILGYSKIRVRCSAYTSGRVSVTARAVARTGMTSQVDADENVKVTFGTQLAGEDILNDVLKIINKTGYYSPITADTSVKSSAGTWHGFIVNSHTGGTLKVWDNTAASGTVLCDTITFAAGPVFQVWPSGIEFSNGLYFDVGGTISITPLFK